MVKTLILKVPPRLLGNTRFSHSSDIGKLGEHIAVIFGLMSTEPETVKGMHFTLIAHLCTLDQGTRILHASCMLYSMVPEMGKLPFKSNVLLIVFQ